MRSQYIPFPDKELGRLRLRKCGNDFRNKLQWHSGQALQALSLQAVGSLFYLSEPCFGASCSVEMLRIYIDYRQGEGLLLYLGAHKVGASLLYHFLCYSFVGCRSGIRKFIGEVIRIICAEISWTLASALRCALLLDESFVCWYILCVLFDYAKNRDLQGQI